MAEQSHLGPSRDGTVLLDIGGDIGAVVIHTSAALAGREIDLSVAGSTRLRTHVAVRERRGDGPSQYAAIYPRLRAGRHRLHRRWLRGRARLEWVTFRLTAIVPSAARGPLVQYGRPPPMAGLPGRARRHPTRHPALLRGARH